MSDDIVRALRELYFDTPSPWYVCCYAADEIERLRAELAAERERADHAERDALRAKLGASEEVNMMMSGEREEIITERDAAIARAKKAEGLLLDAYNTWGEWPQETLARIDALLNKGDGEK